jgi:hypothetical protein
MADTAICNPQSSMRIAAAVLFFLAVFATASAQQAPPPLPPPPQAQQPQEAPRVDARKEVIVNWYLDGQAWIFRDIMSAYEPVKGYQESHGNEGTVAVWSLRLIRELEPGAAKLHEEMLGSPFRIVLLDADRKIIDNDAPAQITTPVGAKTDDTIELRVGVDPATLKGAKVVRVERRTDVGF